MAHSYFFKRPSQGLPCLRKSVTVSFSQTWLDQKLQLPSSQLSHSTPILSLPIPSPISILIKLIFKMDVVENELTDSGLSEYPSIGWTSPNTSQLQFYYGKNWWMWIDDPTWHVIIVKAEKNYWVISNNPKESLVSQAWGPGSRLAERRRSRRT